MISLRELEKAVSRDEVPVEITEYAGLSMTSILDQKSSLSETNVANISLDGSRVRRKTGCNSRGIGSFFPSMYNVHAAAQLRTATRQSHCEPTVSNRKLISTR